MQKFLVIEYVLSYWVVVSELSLKLNSWHAEPAYSSPLMYCGYCKGMGKIAEVHKNFFLYPPCKSISTTLEKGSYWGSCCQFESYSLWLNQEFCKDLIFLIYFL